MVRPRGRATLATAQKLLADRTNEVLVSPASYWEIAIKVHLGKWALNHTYDAFMDIVFNQYKFGTLHVTPAHTARLIGLSDHHRDPFDRLLVAQTLVEGLSLVSVDAVFDAYGVTRLWN